MGTCSTCGAPRCGTHGSLDAGRFVCNDHIIEAKQAAEDRAREAELVERAAMQAERDAVLTRIAAALAPLPLRPPTLDPSFAEWAATGLSIRDLVSWLKTKNIGGVQLEDWTRRKSFGRYPKVRGWVFETGSAGVSSTNSGFHLHWYLIVCEDGVGEYINSAKRPTHRGGGTHRELGSHVPDKFWSAVVDQLLAMTGNTALGPCPPCSTK